MRKILLSSAIILGFASQASAAKCPDVKTIQELLQKFVENNSDSITEGFKEKNPTILTPTIALKDLIPSSSELERKQIPQKSTLNCEYSYQGKSLIDFSIPK